jgi:hypothetical protein
MAARPNGHRIDNNHRESEHEVVTALVHSPVMSMVNPSESPPKLHGTQYDLVLSRNRPLEFPPNPTGNLPKLHFPSFDGTDLKH